MNQTNDMNEMAGRASQVIDAIANAFLSTAEIAAERLMLAGQVAALNQRLQAFSAVLEAVGAQKEALARRLPDAKGATKILLERQIAMLTAQELAVLERAGVPQDAATAALAQADRKLYVRDGGRFVPLDGGPDVQSLHGVVRPALNGANGTAGTNGHDGGAV